MRSVSSRSTFLLALFGLCIALYGMMSISPIQVLAAELPSLWSSSATLPLGEQTLGDLTSLDASGTPFDSNVYYTVRAISLQAGETYDVFMRCNSAALSLHLYDSSGTSVVTPKSVRYTSQTAPNAVCVSYTPATTATYYVVVSNFYTPWIPAKKDSFELYAQKRQVTSVSARVTDISGEPLQGRNPMLVALTGDTVIAPTSSSDGLFNYNEVPTGIYTLWVPGTGPIGGPSIWKGAVQDSFLGASANMNIATWVVVTVGGVNEINYDLRGLTRVHGRVLNPDGSPYTGKLGLRHYRGYNDVTQCLAIDGYFQMAVAYDGGSSYELLAQLSDGTVLKYPTADRYRIPVALSLSYDIGVWQLPHLDNVLTIEPKSGEAFVPGSVSVLRKEFDTWTWVGSYRCDGFNPVSLTLKDGEYKVTFATSALVGTDSLSFKSKDFYYQDGAAEPQSIAISGGTKTTVSIPLPNFGSIQGAIEFPRDVFPGYSSLQLLRWTGSGWSEPVSAEIEGMKSFSYTNVVPGTYTLKYVGQGVGTVYYGGTSNPELAARIEVDSGESLAGLMLALPDPAPTMVGTVRDTAGKALSGAIVELWGTDEFGNPAIIDSDTTDERGYYSVLSPVPGEFTLRAQASGQSSAFYYNADAWSWEDPMLFRLENYQHSGFDFTLDAGSTITGGVATWGHDSIAGAHVSLWTLNVYSGEWECEARVTTDSLGQYLFRGASAGEHVVLFEGLHLYGPRYYGQVAELYRATTFSTQPSSLKSHIDIVAVQTTTVKGFTGSTLGAPLGHIKVVAYPLSEASGTTPHITYSAEDGSYQFVGMSEGRWLIQTEPVSDWAPTRQYMLIDGSELEEGVSEVVGPTLLMKKAGVISGVVRDVQGGLCAGVTVWASPLANFEDEVSTVTDAQGAYRFPALAPGSYTLLFEPSKASGFVPVALSGAHETAYWDSDVAALLQNVAVRGAETTDVSAVLSVGNTVQGSVALDYYQSVDIILEQRVSGAWIEVDSTYQYADRGRSSYLYRFTDLPNGTYRVKLSGVEGRAPSYLPSSYNPTEATVLVVENGMTASVGGARPSGGSLTVTPSTSRTVWAGTFDVPVYLEWHNPESGLWEEISVLISDRVSFENRTQFKAVTFSGLPWGEYRARVEVSDQPDTFRPTYSGNTYDETLAQTFTFSPDSPVASTPLVVQAATRPIRIVVWPGTLIATYYANEDGYFNLSTAEWEGEGASFDGFFKDESLTVPWASSDVVPEGGITLWPRWTDEPYFVTFKLNNGSSDVTGAYNLDGWINPPRMNSVTSKPGYILRGWRAVDGDVPDLGWGGFCEGDATYEAVWEPLVHSVTFVSETTKLSVQSVNHGDDAVIPEVPNRDGYVFDGWNCSPRAIAEDMIVYARWTAVDQISSADHYVYLDSRGGVLLGSSTRTVTYGQGLELPVPSKVGYTFVGWYTASTGGNLVSSPLENVTFDTYLYAQYTPIRYEVTLDGNGGQALGSYLASYGSYLNDVIVPERVGYDFRGWFKDSACTIRWSVYSDTISGPTKLYAGWYPRRYEVIFDGGAGSTVQRALARVDSIVARPANPSRKGYLFAGWYEDEACTLPFGFDGVTHVMGAADLHLYAKWIAKRTVTFIDSGTVIATQVCLEGEAAIAPAVSRIGYVFGGWYSASTGGVVTDLSRVTSDLTVYARWFSTNAYVKKFSATSGKWSRAVSHAYRIYTLTLRRTVGRVRVGWLLESGAATAKVSVDGGKSWRAASSTLVSVSRGKSKTVFVRVFAEQRSVLRTYKVVVKRP